MSAAITPTDDIINSQTEILGMTADNLISFDGQIMTPPNNDSPFSRDIRHVLSHQTTMNIFDPDNGEYGKITFDILSELGIFDMDSFLNPHYWDAEELFKSDIIIKNIDQANAANHLECIHSFLRDREVLQTIEGCTDFNLASPDVHGISPFMRSFIPHKNGIITRSQAQRRLKMWGSYMREAHGFEVTSISTVPANRRSPSSFVLSPDVYSAPKNLASVLPPSDTRSVRSETRSVRSSVSRRSEKRNRRQNKDNDSVGSQSTQTTRDSTIPRSIQHVSKVNFAPDTVQRIDPDTDLSHTSFDHSVINESRRASRIPANSQSLVPHSMICKTTVDSFDHSAYSKTKGDDRSDFIKTWINDVVMNLANILIMKPFVPYFV
jgi:hypothetical protein